MPFTVNIHHLEEEGREYEDSIPLEELDLDALDELIVPKSGLSFRVDVEKHETNLLLQGEIGQIFECECSKCLKKFEVSVAIPDWSGFVALEGEESLSVNNDMVDLTAVLREDILLVLPQHPVCEQGCKGLKPEAGSGLQLDDGEEDNVSSPWNALDHLKLENDKD
jgi:uncharacterized metal-binding protein YceD (DUF177 family)